MKQTLNVIQASFGMAPRPVYFITSSTNMEYIMGFPDEIRNLTQHIGFIRYLNQMIASDAS